ncbi:MAG: YeeE/YedE family protein, partial [Planctomycetota bacterium]
NMVEQEVVLGFVQLRDFGLAVTMGGAMLVTMPIYQIVARLGKRPPLGAEYERFPRRVAPKNVIGGVIFGVGWGLSGVCPGSALASVGVGNWPILFAVAGMLLGAYLQGVLMSNVAPARATPTG